MFSYPVFQKPYRMGRCDPTETLSRRAKGIDVSWESQVRSLPYCCCDRCGCSWPRFHDGPTQREPQSQRRSQRLSSVGRPGLAATPSVWTEFHYRRLRLRIPCPLWEDTIHTLTSLCPVLSAWNAASCEKGYFLCIQKASAQVHLQDPYLNSIFNILNNNTEGQTPDR